MEPTVEPAANKTVACPNPNCYYQAVDIEVPDNGFPTFCGACGALIDDPTEPTEAS